jgi:hypothetical protein
MEDGHPDHRANELFPPGLAQPALRALRAAGYTRLDQLETTTETELRKLHGMGPKALGLLRDALHARGKSFASPDDR